MEGLAALGYLRSLQNKRGRDPEIQQDQFVVGKLTDLYNNAPSDAAREIITQHMQSYAGALNPNKAIKLSFSCSFIRKSVNCLRANLDIFLPIYL